MKYLDFFLKLFLFYITYWTPSEQLMILNFNPMCNEYLWHNTIFEVSYKIVQKSTYLLKIEK